jgi:hypothetical protein
MKLAKYKRYLTLARRNDLFPQWPVIDQKLFAYLDLLTHKAEILSGADPMFMRQKGRP